MPLTPSTASSFCQTRVLDSPSQKELKPGNICELYPEPDLHLKTLPYVYIGLPFVQHVVYYFRFIQSNTKLNTGRGMGVVIPHSWKGDVELRRLGTPALEAGKRLGTRS